MSGYTLKSVDELETIHHGLVKLAGAELGVESFGLQVLDLPPEFSDYPEHDHSEDGQEEVYLVLHGSGQLAIDGERMPVGAGTLVRVGAGTRRKIETGSEAMRILAIGSTPGRPYERPEDFRLAVRS